MPWKEKPSKHNRKNDILLIQASFCMKAEAMKRKYDLFIKQMESGLVLLPPGFSVTLCPPDVDVKLTDFNNHIFEEKEDGK